MEELKLLDIEESEEVEEKERWTIIYDDAAEWAVTRIIEETAEINRLIMICKSQMRPYEQKIEKYQKRQKDKESYLKSLLRAYFATVPHKKTKTGESYELPSAKLVLKSKEPEHVFDDVKLVEYLKSNGFMDFVKQTEKPKWGEFKKTIKVMELEGILQAIDQDGNVIDCIEVVERDPVFEVKF